MSQQNDDFISFDKALRDLQMQSEQLKRLVSEGEIRAFRDGDSMKFKREDLEALREDDSGDEGSDEELVFADSLEDDTGMVTEELSDEDTLLAEDDDEEEEPAPSQAAGAPTRVRATSSGARVRAQSQEEEAATPAWVTGGIILTTVLMFYALTIVYTTATGGIADPFGMFAPQ